MKRLVWNGNELREDMPATLRAVDEYCMALRRWAEPLGVPDLFGLELLLREALNNAVIHGCKQNPDRRVICAVRLRPGRLIIGVRDEGCGFDWKAAMTRDPDAGGCSGRGVFIFNQYSDRVRFGARGNSVVMIKRLEKDGIR